MEWQIHEAGDPSGPPVVLLHGWLGHGREWLPLLPDLDETPRWLCPDLPGHGTPLPPTDSGWGFADVAADLVRALVDDLGLERWHQVGYSMGGRLALYLTTHFPERIEGLMLESCQPGISSPEDRQTRSQLDDKGAARLRAEGVAAFVDRWYQVPLFASLRARPALLAQIKASRQRHDPDGVAAALSALSPGRQPDLWPLLDALTMPVSLLTGALDEKYTGIMTEMAQRIPHANLALIEDAGHNVHAESPEDWRRILRHFLTSR